MVGGGDLSRNSVELCQSSIAFNKFDVEYLERCGLSVVTGGEHSGRLSKIN